MKLKKIIPIITLFILLLCCGIGANAAPYSGSCGTNVKYSLNTDTGLLTISGSGAMKNYSMSSYPWYSYRTSIKNVEIKSGVTSVGDYAFYNYNTIESITIPEGVTQIGAYALLGCSGIAKLTVPESVISIGYEAFYKCSGLTEINWNAKTVGDLTKNNNLFYNAGQSGSGIKVTFGANVEKIPAYLFNPYTHVSSTNFPNITSVVIGDKVTSIGQYSFFVCKNIKNITIGNNVASIDNHAFSYCTSLESITIPNSVTSIGTSAFSGCQNIKSITIPENVTSIGVASFSGCSNITEINWNAKNVSDLTNSTYIFNGAGQNAGGIKVTFGNTVERIPAYLFYPNQSDSSYAAKITSITIGNNVTSIGNYAFYNCKDLQEINWNAKSVSNFPSNNYIFGYAGQNGSGVKVIFGTNVETIPATIFSPNSSSTSYLPNITNVTIGNNVTSIGTSAFRDAVGLKSITIPEKVTNIGGSAFYNCKSLTEINWNAKNVSDFSSGNYVFYCAGQDGNGINITFGNTVEKIPAYAFYPCDGSYYAANQSTYAPKFSNINFGSGVKTIGRSAFTTCSGFSSITIPKNITSIGSNAFLFCSNLSNITVDANNTAYSSVDGVLFNKTGTILIRYPEQKYGSYVIPNNVSTIEPWAFRNCRSLKSITIGTNVTDIGTWAFYQCTGITDIKWNAKNVNDFSANTTIFTQVGTSTNGVTVVFGDTVEHIPAYIFDSTDVSNAPYITSVTIGNNVKSIGDYAFYYCSNITNLTLGNQVSSIGSYTFGNCKFKDITLPNSLTNIAEYAFWGSDITSIKIPSSVKSIGDNAFLFCYNLVSITVDTNNTAYSSVDGMLLDKKGTTLIRCPEGKGGIIVIPDGVKNISEWAFSDCAITDITFPHSIVSVGELAFRGCNSLTNLYYNGSKSDWQNVSIADYGNDYLLNLTPKYNFEHAHEYTLAENGWSWNDNNTVATVTICCNICDDKQTVNAEITETGKSPTCTEGCSKTYKATATYNNQSFENSVVKDFTATGHTEAIDEAVSPTCTETGLTEGKHCSVCDEVLIARSEMAPLGHRVIEETTVSVDPITIDNSGTIPFVLTDGVYYSNNHSNSSSSNLKFIAQHPCTLTLNYGVSSEQNYDKLYILQNNTTKDTISGNVSNKTLTLTLVAGDTVTVRYSKDASTSSKQDQGWVSLDYEFVSITTETDISADTIEPTCINNVVCSYCQTVVKETSEHTGVVTPAVAPTCTKTGLTEGSHCSVCDEVLVAQKVVRPTGHTRVVAPAVEPTCTETGLTEGEICSVCKTVFVAQNVVDALGHTEVIDKAVDATCTETGLTEGKHCSVCDEVLVEQTIVIDLI